MAAAETAAKREHREESNGRINKNSCKRAGSKEKSD